MAKRKKTERLGNYVIERVDPRDSWQVETEYKVHGRILTPGSEVSIKGERGRFRFLKAVTTGTGSHYLDFIGGPENGQVFRSFYPHKIKRVHRIVKTRENLLAA